MAITNNIGFFTTIRSSISGVVTFSRLQVNLMKINPNVYVVYTQRNIKTIGKIQNKTKVLSLSEMFPS